MLPDVDETAFEVLMKFVYSGEVPKLKDFDEEAVKSILVVANRFGVTELKLYVESILIEKFLDPSKAAEYLLLADSTSCGLLKEFCMNEYITYPTTFMDSEDDWESLQESNKLIVELLMYTTFGRKKYSSVVDDGYGYLDDADGFDVTSLRERLQRFDLDVDGSRTMLVARWKNYLLRGRNDK